MKLAVLDALLDARAAKRPVVLVTELATGRQHLVYIGGSGAEGALDAELAAAAGHALRADRSGCVGEGDERVFLQVFNSPLRLFVVGAVHIAQALVPMASLLGYEIVVIDPRQAFASAERFPGVEVVTDWPDDALVALAPDRRSAVVTLTHDPKLDDAALGVALRSDAFYIGSLGSKRTHAARLERLSAAGFEEETLARIHGPIGLAIGATSPAEIATAVLAEITRVLRTGDAR